MEEPELLDDIPEGMDEEEWTSHIACLYSTFAATPSGGKPLRIGQGSRPCYVCGSDAHSWVKCEKRRRGKCGVCGRDDHYTRFCSQRYYPDPKLAITRPLSPAPKSTPTTLKTPQGKQAQVWKRFSGLSQERRDCSHSDAIHHHQLAVSCTSDYFAACFFPSVVPSRCTTNYLCASITISD